MKTTRETGMPDARWLDLTNEKYRTYDFGNGRTYSINNPVSLNVKSKPNGDSHRVLDALGKSHYIPAGWIALSWEARDGAPAFDF